MIQYYFKHDMWKQRQYFIWIQGQHEKRKQSLDDRGTQMHDKIWIQGQQDNWILWHSKQNHDDIFYTYIF